MLDADVERDAGTVERDPDHIEDLGDQIVVLAAHIHAATQRLLALIAEFDRIEGWAHHGYRDCAEWLVSRTGMRRGAAQEKVRAARALVDLPLTREAMARGELSFSKVRALTRVADATNEKELLDLAKGATTEALEPMLRAYRKGSRKDEVTRERERHESRRLSIFPDDEGMYVIKGRLTPEVAAALMKAIDAASDALFRQKPDPQETPEERRRRAAQRRADAIGLIAEQAMRTGFGGEPESDVPVSGTRADRYTVVLHVEPATLAAAGEPGRSELEDGTRLSAESARRLACDAGLVKVAHSPDGGVLGVGRKTRTIPPALRRALDIRDRGCRFPGCGRRFTDAHHVQHWADGGETSLANTLLLCRHHHALVHEGGWGMGLDRDRRAIFFDPRGGMHYDGSWKAPELPTDAVDALLAHHHRLGIEPGAWTPSARWESASEIPDDVYFGVTGAM